MEYFGFASGSSKTGPAFPYMPESVLNNYPNTLLEHPVVPTAVGFLNTYMPTPDAKNLIHVVQTWADKSLELLEKPAIQAVGIGLSASICAYGAWAVRKRWRNNIVPGKSDCFQGIDSCESHAKESFFDERLHDLGSLDVEPSDPNTDMTHRQLSDTRAKLDDLRYQLNRLEGEKDLLAAEVVMRKKIVAQLQGEIHFERDKRQQAELRMEMMEWENTHLRRLRKDVAVKDGKIDMLEACLKEKDAVHDQLFQENVIMPKSVAEARAKEYEILHTKVQKYEMDAVMKRNSEAPYKPCRHESATSTADQVPYNDTTDTMDTAMHHHGCNEPYGPGSSGSYQPSEWDKSPSSTGSAFQPISFATNMIKSTRNTLFSSTNWSNRMDKLCVDGIEKASACDIKNQDIEKPCSQPVKDVSWIEARQKANSKRSAHKVVSREYNTKLATKHGFDRSSRAAMCAAWSEHSSQPQCSADDEPGVLGQIRSFFSGFSHSGSESVLATTAETPAQMADVLPSQSRLWDRSFEDKANNCCQEDDEDDACSPSVSDGQSSIFMSASCGSDPSDDDTRDVSRSCNVSKNRGKSLKRATSSAKAKPLKKTTSPRKGGSMKRAKSQRRPISPVKEKHLETVISPKEPAPSKVKSVPDKDSPIAKVPFLTKTVLSDPPTSEIKADKPGETPRQGRARQRCRLRKSRSKLTTNTDASKCSQSHLPVENSGIHSPTSEKPVSEKCAAGSSVTHTIKRARDNDSNQHVKHLPQVGYQTVHGVGDINKNSAGATDADSEESWIVITPAK